MAEETSGAIGPWWLVAFSGLSSLVLGVMLLVWPVRTLLVIVVVGIQLLFIGVRRLGGPRFRSARSQRGMLVLSGFGGILVGSHRVGPSGSSRYHPCRPWANPDRDGIPATQRQRKRRGGPLRDYLNRIPPPRFEDGSISPGTRRAFAYVGVSRRGLQRGRL